MRNHVDHLQQRLALAERHRGALDIALTAMRADEALAEAEAVDAALPLAGEVLTVKACFDVAGWTTHAGSQVLADAPPATADAPMVAVLRHRGAIVLAQTNMTEFAYGALGLNATYGTPTTPLCPGENRVAGGSTSGGAVAVALEVADISLGSDTSGSVRIPAAFCGVAGFKPTQGRYPDAGMIPLAPSFDSPGIVAPSAAACRRIDAAIVGVRLSGSLVGGASGAAALAGRRFLVPADVSTDGVESVVATAFAGWIEALAAAGAIIDTRPLPYLCEASQAARDGLAIAVEAYDWHRDLIAEHLHRYDPRVGPRIMLGATALAADYVRAMRRLRGYAERFHDDLGDAAAMLLPTVPILPPPISDVQSVDTYLAANTEVLRLTEFANRLNLPSISVPGYLRDRRPIGLMMTGRRDDDADLLEVATAFERLLSGG